MANCETRASKAIVGALICLVIGWVELQCLKSCVGVMPSATQAGAWQREALSAALTGNVAGTPLVFAGEALSGCNTPRCQMFPPIGETPHVCLLFDSIRGSCLNLYIRSSHNLRSDLCDLLAAWTVTQLLGASYGSHLYKTHRIMGRRESIVVTKDLASWAVRELAGVHDLTNLFRADIIHVM